MSSVLRRRDANDVAATEPGFRVRKSDTPASIDIPNSYVSWPLKNQKPLPLVTLGNLFKNMQRLSLAITPSVAIYALFHDQDAVADTCLERITAGYHQHFLAVVRIGAAQGSSSGDAVIAASTIATPTPTSTRTTRTSASGAPHVGWMSIKPRYKPTCWSSGAAWCHPPPLAGLGWGDWRGVYFFVGAACLWYVHRPIFCVSSLAHWLCKTQFDDNHTARDHFTTVLVTVGESYHNFHHQLPMDYPNAIRWYQYDPTKWLRWAFPESKVKTGQLTMQLKQLWAMQDGLAQACDIDELRRESLQEQSVERVPGIIADFLDEHFCGYHLPVN
ncbi:uncharacterized protein PHACADRAFT_194167 [Phanerochaete carnosa HHB-10118-sp]|uniref:Fatty acid desaturase domain-containing protein n=1 Tax=Phanerochaete carnosa (strain HHB-10118-sp) TaxID=650164 RepID=K5X1C0_PHACS|nr:uncharacterized protein PHACADRAFT_194167 [Phanerochaete carnosa HHB-10118-sp]EKM56567.1 hypothetical protein PHACADRAFT_194167 [Phanerochaete carnosa HHB-10118-sp]